MIEDMTVRNLSPATQRSYLAAVSKLSRYFGRSPDCLELDDIRAFQVHLVAIGISWPALNQIVCALRFFYGVTLGHDAIPERISYARQPSKLPVVLSADEVVRFLEAIPSLKSRTALTTASASSSIRRSPFSGSDLDHVFCHFGLCGDKMTQAGKCRRVSRQAERSWKSLRAAAANEVATMTKFSWGGPDRRPPLVAKVDLRVCQDRPGRI
jgi:site-specific recombinase XerC